MRALLAALAIGLLAGCAGASRDGIPLPAEAVAVTPRPGAAIPVARQHSEVIVRAFLRDETGARREVGGADCLLAAPHFEARFRSPGRVVVPVPERGAPALDIHCRAAGLEGSARRGVVRDRPRGWAGHPWHDPFWGPRWPGDPFWGEPRSGVSIGVTIGDPLWDPWWPRRGRAFYPDVEVELR